MSNTNPQHPVAVFNQLPDEAFVRLPTVRALFACSSASVWRGVRAGRIPKPVKLSERTTGWRVGELRVALAEVGNH
ncbi:MAG: helix-turn-helix transcriptional regulator [Methylophilaceae bacterium]